MVCNLKTHLASMRMRLVIFASALVSSMIFLDGCQNFAQPRADAYPYPSYPTSPVYSNYPVEYPHGLVVVDPAVPPPPRPHPPRGPKVTPKVDPRNNPRFGAFFPPTNHGGTPGPIANRPNIPGHGPGPVSPRRPTGNIAPSAGGRVERMAYFNRLLVESVKNPERGHSADGQVDMKLCSLAAAHSQDMARRGKADYEGFQQTAQSLSQGRYQVHEIVTEAVTDGSAPGSARQCIQNFSRDREKKVEMDRFHRTYCYSMELRGRQVFCTGLFVD